MAKVSVIIPVYNKEKYVKEAIQSVLNQTYKNIEILVLNDASTDKSKDIILEIIEKHPEIIFIDEKENLGVCKARNKLVDLASGEYILPFDADDVIDKTYVEKFADALDKNPEYSVVYCNVKYFQSQNKYICPNIDYEDIIYNNYLISSSMFRKADFYKAGRYKEWLNDIGCEDWELWISFTKKGFKFYKIDEVLYFYRVLGSEPCMTQIYKENFKLVRYLIFKHHISLYLHNRKFIDIITDENFFRFTKLKQRAKKYKKLFNIFLSVSIVEFIAGIAMLISATLPWGGGGKCP